MKKLLVMLLTVTMMVASLSGCGQTEETTTSKQDTTTTEKKETSATDKKEEASADEVITIDILSSTITEGVEGELEQKMADAYMEANPNVVINYIGTPSNEITKKMTAYVANGDIPDAFIVFEDFLPQATELEIMEDIRPYLDDEYYNGFVPSVLDGAIVGNQMVRFPWFSVPTAVIYRTDWLDETGLDIPTDWDQFLEVAKAMTKDNDGDNKVDQWGFSMVGTNNGSGRSRFMNIVRSFGCEDAVLENGAWTTLATDPNFKEALSYFTALSTEHGVVPPGPTEAGYTEAVNYLATEKTGMMVTGSNGMGLLLTKNPDLDGKLGSFAIPEKDGKGVGVAAGVTGYSVSAGSEHKEIVIDYLKFMNNPESAVEFAQKTGRLPTRVESTTAPIFEEPTYKGFIQAMDKVYNVEQYPMYKELLDAIGLAYTNIMANGVSVEDAMADLIETDAELLEEANDN